MVVILIDSLEAGCSTFGTDDGFVLDDSLLENATAVEASTVAKSLVTIEQSQFTGYKFFEKSNEVINDSESLERLWKDIHTNRIPLPELPKIDFAEYIGTSAMMGVQNSGWYSIGILEIVEAENVVRGKTRKRN